MRARGRLAWIPPFLLGFVGATCGELAGGLLLYSGEGLLRALTLLLAVELGALALGLWVGGAETPTDPLERVRRRWLFCLVAFTAAAGFAAAWQMVDGTADSFASRGLGLALLGGLPLYAAGAVLGALRQLRGRSDVASTSRIGAVAALGAAAGVLTTGLALIAWLRPVSILLLCVVLVSVAALLHGWILEGAGNASPAEGPRERDAGDVPGGDREPDPRPTREEGP